MAFRFEITNNQFTVTDTSNSNIVIDLPLKDVWYDSEKLKINQVRIYGVNAGEITAHQTTTTANITMVMPADSGQTAICCATVPANENWIVKVLQTAMVISGNQTGSAQMQFQVRERGGAWQTKRFQGITNNNDFNELLEGGIVIEEQSDVRWRV